MTRKGASVDAAVFKNAGTERGSMTGVVGVVTVSSIAGVATGLGALPVFFRARVTHRVYDAALGLAAGLMVAASVFGLILPGTEEGTLAAVMAGLLLGGLGLLAGNYAIPHLHAQYRRWLPEGGATASDAEAMSVTGERPDHELSEYAGPGGSTDSPDQTDYAAAAEL